MRRLWCCKRKRTETKTNQVDKEEQGIRVEVEVEVEVPGPTSPFPSHISLQHPQVWEDGDSQTPIELLTTQSFTHLPLYTLAGLKTYAKVTRVLDGDTIEIVILVRLEAQKHILRLVGIDAPELKPKLTCSNRTLQIQAAQHVRSWLTQTLENAQNLVWVELTGKDCFGRWVGEVFLEHTEFLDTKKEVKTKSRISVNKRLLMKGFVKQYDKRRKRTEWTKKELEKILQTFPMGDST